MESLPHERGGFLFEDAPREKTPHNDEVDLPEDDGETRRRSVFGSSALPDDMNAEMELAFGFSTMADELTEREIDELFVEEMGRRDRPAEAVADPGKGAREHSAPPEVADSTGLNPVKISQDQMDSSVARREVG